MIKFSDPRSDFVIGKKKYIKIFSKIINSGNYILSNETINFEKKFSHFVGMKYGVGVNSATDGLIISLKNYNIGKGDEVITSPHTALATIAAIINTGAKPTFVDINENDYCIDVTKIEKKINKRTKAIIPIHIFGHPAEIKSLIKISKKYKIPIIEDCSQSLGSKIDKKYAGSFGQISVFSFYPTKNLGAIGDGGMILTNSLKNYQKLKQIRQYGWDDFRNVRNIGFNSRLDELQSGLLNYKLTKLNNFNLKRNQIANLYNKYITNRSIIKPNLRSNCYHSYHLYVIRTKKRNKFINFLKSNGIQTAIHYKNNIISDKIYSDYCNFSFSELKNFIKLNKEFVSLPMHTGLTKKDVIYITKIINNF